MKPLALVTLACLTASCSGLAAESTRKLKTRASVDLDCHVEILKVRAHDADSNSVTGCGKTAVYRFDAAGSNDWKRVSDVTEAKVGALEPTTQPD